MYLVLFLTIGIILSITLGEFGQYPFGSTLSISLPDVLLLLTLTFLSIWRIGIKKDLEVPFLFKVLVLFNLVGLISLLFSAELRGGLYLLRFFVYGSSFLMGYFLIKEKTVSIDKIASIFVYSAAVISLLGFLQFIFFPDLEILFEFGYDPHKYRLFSTFLDPNFVGVYLNICLALAFYLWNKNKSKDWLVFIAVILIAIVLTFSRSAYLMLFVQTFIFSILKMRKLLIILIAAALVLYLVVPKFAERVQGAFNLDKTSLERIESWQRGILVFQQRPILGVGFNNLRYVFETNNLFRPYQEKGGNAGAGVDSSLIFVLATTGILGFIIYILFWLRLLFLSFARKINEKHNLFPLIFGCSVLGLLVSSQFINSLFYPPIMLIIFILSGSLIGLSKEE